MRGLGTIKKLRKPSRFVVGSGLIGSKKAGTRVTTASETFDPDANKEPKERKHIQICSVFAANEGKMIRSKGAFESRTGTQKEKEAYYSRLDDLNRQPYCFTKNNGNVE